MRSVILTSTMKALKPTAVVVARRQLHASRTASFLYRSPADVVQDKTRVVTSDNGAHETRRYLLRNDECGFSMQHEIFTKGAIVPLEFRNHVVAMMVTSGRGTLTHIDSHSGERNAPIDVQSGSFFALSASDIVELEAETDELHAVSVMNPPLVGSEQRLPNGVFPVVDADGNTREALDVNASRRLFDAPESLKTGSSPMKNHPLF